MVLTLFEYSGYRVSTMFKHATKPYRKMQKSYILKEILFHRCEYKKNSAIVLLRYGDLRWITWDRTSKNVGNIAAATKPQL